ncbi:hypothetical protein N7486_011157 [Penicillium sp. IBT 16267x]|nr:hypothetical protein N7486_011157 [Penicillium sp. IBT 16267x]
MIFFHIYLCSAKFFKFDSDYDDSMFLGEIPDPTTAETCLKEISQDKILCQKIYGALDEGANIYMMAGQVAEENRYIEIEFDWIKVPSSREITCEWDDRFGWVPVDGLDESTKEQGEWMMNPQVFWKKDPFILIPRLEKETDDAIFVQRA